MAQKLFDKASLVMIPSQYKEGKIYNIKPEDQSSSFEFERGSAATRVNSSGLIETLHNEATNSLLQSNQFDTTWVNSSTTETSGQSGYDGSSDAWLLTKIGANGRIYQDISSSGVQTFSVYAKANTSNWVSLWTNVGTSYFDLANGIKGSTTSATTIGSEIESVGNGWYRCSLIFNTEITAVRIFVADNDLDVSGTSGSIYIQDAQLESGYFATPYIETTTEAVTRPNRHDTPRLDYSGTEPALLLEPQRTNLIANANSYSGNLVYYTVTSGQNSPDGESNATLFVEKTNTASHIINSNGASISGGQTYTYSFFIKYAGKQNIPVNASDGLSGFAANIDILNGVVNSGIAEIQEFEDGWYRVSMTRTAGAGATNATIQMNFGNITGDGTSGFYLFGYQIEQGSYATSYIPTNGQAETRLSENIEKTGLSSVIGQTEGTIFFEFEYSHQQINLPFFKVFENTLNFYEIIALSDFKLRSRARIGGSYLAAIDTSSVVSEGTHKAAIIYKSQEYKFYLDGSLVGSSTENSIVSNPSEINYFNNNNNLKQFLLFPTVLSDDECITLTTL